MNWYKIILARHNRIAQSGEFWITDGGQVQEASGDGEYNHEGYVIEIVKSQIIGDSEFHSYTGGDYSDWEGWKEAVEAEKAAEKGLDPRFDDVDLDELLFEYLKENDISDEQYSLVEGSGDARLYAMKEWGWKRLEGTNVETWTFTDKDLSAIASGLFEAYDEIDPETDISIYVGAENNKWISATMQELEDKTVAELRGEVVHPQMQGAYQNALNAVDKPSNSFYKDWN